MDPHTRNSTTITRKRRSFECAVTNAVIYIDLLSGEQYVSKNLEKSVALVSEGLKLG